MTNCLAAQMDDLAPLLGSREDVVSWERMSTGLQREIGVSSVCLYDYDLVDAEHASAIAQQHVDLADPTFADIGTLVRLACVAAGRPDSGWLRIDRVPDAIRRTLSLSGLHHERLRLQP